MKRSRQTLAVSLIYIVGLIWPLSSYGISEPCPPFFLRTETGAVINPITGQNADEPFSTRKTCGACHDVEKISKGYHFMMDWDKAGDGRFKDTDTPWLVSTGLTGGLITYGYFQLAKKKISLPDEIDLTAFDFVARVPEASKGFQKPGCAGCHPGGGMLEFDRDGQRYDQRLAKNPELAQSLDGDYYKSAWDKTGVIEPDCFFCHGNRYQMQARIIQIKNLNFKWAGVEGAGIGKVIGRVSAGEKPKVIYNKRLFNEDGTFYMPDMIFRPGPESCLRCHASIDLGKRGNSWGDPSNPDVHHLAGLICIDCHSGDINHNFAKGNALDGRVADDLDNSMRSCRDCHTQGYKGATRMEHRSIRKDHLDKLSCEACHIPMLRRSAVGAMFLNTGIFGKHGQTDAKAFGDEKPWKPAYVVRKKDKDGIARITPVNPMRNTLFTNKDQNGLYVPLFLSEVEKAYNQCKDRMSERKPAYDFHKSEDMVLMLSTLGQTLEGNRRFSAINPRFHTGGLIYSISTSGELIKDTDITWVSRLPFFSISHNVSPARQALGAGGCRDCHSKDAHLFNGLVVTDYFGNNGKAKTISMASFLNLPPLTQKWNSLFGLCLKTGPWFFITLAGILMVLAKVRLLSGRHPAATALSASSPLFTSSALVFLFIFSHAVITKDAGILFSLQKIFMEIPSPAGLLIMLAAAAGFVYQVRKRVKSTNLATGLYGLGFMTAGTGMFLWAKPVDTAAITFFSFVLHGICAGLVSAALIWLSIWNKEK